MKRTLVTLITAGALALTLFASVPSTAAAPQKLTATAIASAVIRLEKIALRLDKGETEFVQMLSEVNEVSKDMLLRYSTGMEGDEDLIGNLFYCVGQQIYQTSNAIDVAQQLTVRDDKVLRTILSLQLDTIRLYSFVAQLLISATL